jgi:virginiamycin A acetyltransferase
MKSFVARGQRSVHRLVSMLYRKWILQNTKNSSIEKPALVHKTAGVWNSRLMSDVQVGAYSNIYDSILGAANRGEIEIGDFCTLRDVKILGAASIGRRTSVTGPARVMSFFSPVKIGSFCSISWYVTIQEFNHRIDQCATASIAAKMFNEGKRQDLISKTGIVIGNDVWIGAQCTIVSGATIGNGAVIGANSVVTGSVPPYAVVVGSPARIIRYRFSESIINLLQEVEWWNWDDEKIKRNRALFEGELTLEKLTEIVP